MKNNKLIHTLTATAIAAGISFAAPLASADDTKVKVKDDKVKIKTDDGDIKIKGDNAEAIAKQMLTEEETIAFKRDLNVGYVIPQERYTYLQPVPETYVTTLPTVPEGMVYRYFDGTVYTVNPQTYTVVETKVLVE